MSKCRKDRQRPPHTDDPSIITDAPDTPDWSGVKGKWMAEDQRMYDPSRSNRKRVPGKSK